MDTTQIILILILITIALWIYGVVDIIRGVGKGDKYKIFWLVVVLLFPIMGVILYYFLGKKRIHKNF